MGVLLDLSVIERPDTLAPKVVTKNMNMPRRNPKSPILLTMKAFLPAFDAESFRYQKPMSRYEQRPTPSQPTNMRRRLFAVTRMSIMKTKRLRYVK